MNEDCKAWFELGIQFAVAAATVGAVWAALFGRWFQSKFQPPKLRLSVQDPNGDRRMSEFDGQPTEAIWCHIRVENERRYSPATFVEVRLLAIEEFDAAEQPFVVWTGESQLSWRSQDRLRKTPLTMGPPYDCDLFVLAREFLLIRPTADTPRLYKNACHTIVTLKAFSLEADSPAVKVRIDWDGGWPTGTPETQRHLRFRVISQ
jgi:hypothetical protein